MKSLNYYYPMEKEYEIPSAQSSMKVDDCSMTNDPYLEFIIKTAKEDNNYQEIIPYVRVGLERSKIKNALGSSLPGVGLLVAGAQPTSEGKQQFGDGQWPQDIHPFKSKEITAD